jgi:D-cysteine desulfhydrase
MSTAHLLRCYPSLCGDFSLWVVHDEAFAKYGGGNKARKIGTFLDEAEKLFATDLITNGGTQSNHARVTAIAAAARGLGSHLVLHGDPQELQAPSGNLLLMLLAGAQITIVHAESISSTIHEIATELKAGDRRPYVIPGGGHSVGAARIYRDTAKEVWSGLVEKRIEPEVIIVPSGTGTTQAGLAVGFAECNSAAQVIGISVGRRNPRGSGVVESCRERLCCELDLPANTGRTLFLDDWVGQGYGIADARVYDVIKKAGAGGLMLDPTYTGKAYLGMSDLLDRGAIRDGANILFWHTGGLMNLLSDRMMAPKIHSR